MSMCYMVHRTIQSVLLLIAVTFVVFMILHITPGDPALIMLGDGASPETVAALRQSMGLDQPLHIQYFRYMGNLAHGDLGVSIRTQSPVLPYVLQFFPATIELALAAMLVAVLVGLPAGIVSALRQYSIVDRVLMIVALLGQSMPGYWLGLMLIWLFAVQFRVLPASGRGEGLDRLFHLILPSITLASFLFGLLIRLTRSAMLEVIEQDYVRTARAKGLSELATLWRHILKNGMIPVVTVLGLQVGTLLGGAVITETIFAWPGVGTLAIQSIFARDYPVVQAVVLIMAAIFIIVNWLIDLSYRLLDPRITLS